MRQSRCSRLSRFAFLASSAMLLLGHTAIAQTVQVFDNAPSIEQLRSIMVPESHQGLTRSIVIQRPDTDSSSTSVQHISTQVMAAQRPQADDSAQPASPVTRVAANVAVPATRAPAASAAPVMHAASNAAPPRSTAPTEAGAVAFHVNFAFNSAVLPESAIPMINLIAQLMKESPDVKVRVEGHTDAAGSFDYNKALSERRALSVAQYLVTQGIEPSRLFLAGKGPSEPLTQNRYDPANRRVQFVRVS